MADSSDRPERLVRYDSAQRTRHWLVVIAFVFTAASGLGFFHPSLFWLVNLLGGGPWSVILHPFVGIVMVLAFWSFAGPLWDENRIGADDRAWLQRLRDVVDRKEKGLPDAGKYNAGQKVLYLTMVICLAVLLLSGLVIWRRYFSVMFPVGLIRAAALLHALAAFVLLLGVVIHVVAALWVKGSMEAMLRGSVTLGWAYKHHRAWFRSMIRPGAGR